MARGSVYKRHGGWAYKIDTGFNPETDKRRQATKQGFRTKKEAEN
ncbi:Arm DNA-binding domain-containing protein, partial [Ilumatobacter sp.]